MKSVVVEIKNDFAAVLSDDGSIVKVKNQNYVVGQVIVMKKQKIQITKKLALGVASAAALILTCGVGAWAYSAPYSYVSLDVNPSIEYTLNRFERVIDVKAVNDDGQVILDEINIDGLTNQSIEDAIISTVKQISQDGYFDGSTTEVATGSAIEIVDTTNSVNSIDGGIIITVANGNTEISEEITKEISEAVDDLVSDDVQVEVTSVGYDRVQEAKELGMTPGKLNLIEKLQASSTNPESILLEDWKDRPVKEIMKAIKANRKATTATTDLEDSNTNDANNIPSNEDSIEPTPTGITSDVEKDSDESKEAVIEKEKKEKEVAKEAAKKLRESQKEADEKAKEDAKEIKESQKETAKKAKELDKKSAEKAKENEKSNKEKSKENSRSNNKSNKNN